MLLFQLIQLLFFFLDIDDVQESLCELDVIIPPLCTLFTSGYALAMHHIEIENARCSVPYQDGSLAASAWCDCLIDKAGCPTKSHQWWVVPQGKLAVATKQH